MVKPVRLVIYDEPTIRRIRRLAEGRGIKRLTRAAREMLHERLRDLEEHGDPLALKRTKPDATTPPGRSGAKGVSPEPQPVTHETAGD
jgi:hypothetical protein